jgi:hypothetical protein
VIRHITVHPVVRPAIVLFGLIAGFGLPDLWTLYAMLLATWFIDVKCWDPYEQKSDEAHD